MVDQGREIRLRFAWIKYGLRSQDQEQVSKINTWDYVKELTTDYAVKFKFIIYFQTVTLCYFLSVNSNNVFTSPIRDRMLTNSPWPPSAETRGPSQVTKQETIADPDAFP
jgi:hypothetical protein